MAHSPWEAVPSVTEVFDHTGGLVNENPLSS